MEESYIVGIMAIKPGCAIVSLMKPSCRCIKLYDDAVDAMTELRQLGVLARMTDLDRTYVDYDVDGVHYSFNPTAKAQVDHLKRHGYICVAQIDAVCE